MHIRYKEGEGSIADWLSSGASADTRKEYGKGQCLDGFVVGCYFASGGPVLPCKMRWRLDLATMKRGVGQTQNEHLSKHVGLQRGIWNGPGNKRCEPSLKC